MNRNRARMLAALAMMILSSEAVTHGTEKLGRVHFPISCSPAAQQQFDRALAMLHSFWFPQAPDAFAQIAAAEPECAMAFWGMAIGARSNPLVGAPAPSATQKGAELLAKAKAIGGRTQRERDYIAALEEYYRDWKTRGFPERVLAYEAAMQRLFERYPDDIEAAVFYALALNEAITVAPPDKTYARHTKAAAICEQVLARHNDHPGALHFLIHSYDFPALASRGVSAADQYADVAPSAPHARHMPSHIYSMLGLWEASIRANQSALGIASNYVHAMDFMVYAHLQLAQDQAARRLLETAAQMHKAGAAAQRTPTGALLTVYTAYAAIPARYAIERGAWDEAAALEVRPTAPPADAITHFTRAIGFSRLGNVEGARQEVVQLQRLRDELLGRDDQYWADQVDIQRVAAAAWAALAAGQRTEAERLMQVAADREDASEKHVAMENRLWPMRELLGELLLELDKADGALKQFKVSLETTRNRLRSLHGAAVAAERSGQHVEAAAFYERLIALAANADTDRPELQRAKAFLADAKRP